MTSLICNHNQRGRENERRRAHTRCPEQMWILRMGCRQSEKAEVAAQGQIQYEREGLQSLPGNISLPYDAGLSEVFARLLKKYNIQSTMKPCNTILQNLVRPKDKRPLSDNAGVVYNMACKQCLGRYTGTSISRDMGSAAEGQVSRAPNKCRILEYLLNMQNQQKQ